MGPNRAFVRLGDVAGCRDLDRLAHRPIVADVWLTLRSQIGAPRGKPGNWTAPGHLWSRGPQSGLSGGLLSRETRFGRGFRTATDRNLIENPVDPCWNLSGINRNLGMMGRNNRILSYTPTFCAPVIMPSVSTRPFTTGPVSTGPVSPKPVFMRPASIRPELETRFAQPDARPTRCSPRPKRTAFGNVCTIQARCDDPPRL